VIRRSKIPPCFLPVRCGLDRLQGLVSRPAKFRTHSSEKHISTHYFTLIVFSDFSCLTVCLKLSSVYPFSYARLFTFPAGTGGLCLPKRSALLSGVGMWRGRPSGLVMLCWAIGAQMRTGACRSLARHHRGRPLIAPGSLKSSARQERVRHQHTLHLPLLLRHPPAGLGRTRRRRPSEARLPEHWGAGRRSTGGWVSIRLTCFAFQLFRTWQ
jgi:hypothetical protein